jgi:hypothetical protein
MSMAKKEKVADLQKILQESISSSSSTSTSSSDKSYLKGFMKRDLEAICKDGGLFDRLYKTFNTEKEQNGLRKVCKKIVERKQSTLLRNIQSNKDIEDLIVQTYQDSLVYRLADGIPTEILLYDEICGNPNAIDLLKKRVAYENRLGVEEYNKLSNKVNWEYLSMNPNAIELLRANPNKIDWRALSMNPNAIDLLRERIAYENTLEQEEYNRLLNRINWMYLSKNSGTVELLRDNLNKIRWGALSENSDAGAADLLEANPDKIDWWYLSANAGAIKIIKSEYKRDPKSDKINWRHLSSNTNKKAIGLFEDNLDKIHWGNLSQNTNKKAIKLLELRYKIFSGEYTPITYKTRPSFLSKAIQFLQEEKMKEPTSRDWSLNWKHLSANPEAMVILNAEYKRNSENNEIILSALCKNPNAMDIILKEIKAGRIKTEWQLRTLATNPSIFTI